MKNGSADSYTRTTAVALAQLEVPSRIADVGVATSRVVPTPNGRGDVHDLRRTSGPTRKRLVGNERFPLLRRCDDRCGYRNDMRRGEEVRVCGPMGASGSWLTPSPPLSLFRTGNPLSSASDRNCFSANRRPDRIGDQNARPQPSAPGVMHGFLRALPPAGTGATQRLRAFIDVVVHRSGSCVHATCDDSSTTAGFTGTFTRAALRPRLVACGRALRMAFRFRHPRQYNTFVL